MTSPISRPIASAVPAWSPVIILTLMPAVWQSAIASIASGRGGSTMPHTPRNSRSCRSSIVSASVPDAHRLARRGEDAEALRAELVDRRLPPHDVERLGAGGTALGERPLEQPVGGALDEDRA